MHALRDVSLTAGAGEILGLLGSNGAGKTTLIKILATLIVPDSGTATIGGHDLIKQPRQVRRHIGLVNTSERSFYWRLTGRQNLEFFASLWDFSKPEIKRRVAGLLDMTGLNDKADTPFMNYSSGQQQRLAVARALLADPQILLLDKPTRSLDPVGAAELRTFARMRLAGELGKTIIWCTHNLKEAGDICDRLAIIHKGRLAACGSLAQIQSLMEAESLYRLKIDRWNPDLAAAQNWPPTEVIRSNGCFELEMKAAEDQVPALLCQMVNAGINVFCCTRREASLEAAFKHLIK